MMSVFLSCFNVQPNIFVVMKCCVVALSLFYLRYPNLESWSLIFSSTTHELRGARVEEYANYVNKLRQNVGLKTWLWRKIVTSQTANTKYKWPPYATDRNPPPWKFSAYVTVRNVSFPPCLCHILVTVRWRSMNSWTRDNWNSWQIISFQIDRFYLNKIIGLTMRSDTWNRFPIKICDWFLAYFTCGVKLLELEYRYAQVWIIAKRWK